MKKKILYIIELLVWFLIILGALFFFIYNNNVKDNAQNTYYILVDDAGGLVNGSPVRLMGINIGHVKDVKIFDNKVFISFLVTKENIQLPKKTAAIIEFYGLGGSTSLELMQDNSIDTTDRDVIHPIYSYRVKDLWDGQKQVAQVMIDIYGGIGRTIQGADLLNKKEYIKQSKLVKNFTEQANLINTAQSVVIYKLTENVSKNMDTLQENIEEMVEINE